MADPTPDTTREVWHIFGPMYRLFAVLLAVMLVLDHWGPNPPWQPTVDVLLGVGALFISLMQAALSWWGLHHA